MKQFFTGLLCLLAAVIHNSCAPSAAKVKGSDSQALVIAWDKQAGLGVDDAKSPAGITIPIVIFKNLGAGFTQTNWATGKSGNYRMWQWKRNTNDRISESITLRVIGASGKGPILLDAPCVASPGPGGKSINEPREWKSIYVPGLDRELRYYLIDFAFGDTNDRWATEIFTIIGPDGAASSYQATVEATDSTQIPKLFSKLGVK